MLAVHIHRPAGCRECEKLPLTEGGRQETKCRIEFFFSFQSEPEIEYYLPELQASHSSVANKPWPEGSPQTQRLQSGEMEHLWFYGAVKNSLVLL